MKLGRLTAHVSRFTAATPILALLAAILATPCFSSSPSGAGFTPALTVTARMLEQKIDLPAALALHPKALSNRAPDASLREPRPQDGGARYVPVPYPWASRVSNTNATLDAAAAGDFGGTPLYMCVGTGSVLSYSVDGTDWLASSTGGPGYLNIDYGAGQFIATCGNDYLDIIRPDGIVRIRLFGGAYDILWGAVTYAGGGTWVVSGSFFDSETWDWVDLTCRTGDNGASWSLCNMETSSTFQRVLDSDFGNGRYVRVKEAQGIWYSLDGCQWVRVTSVTGQFQSVTWGNGVWVAVGDAGRIARSTDAINWTSTTVGAASRWEVFQGGGFFVACGPNSEIATSADGNSWTEGTSPVQTNFEGGAYGAAGWICVGEQGVIIQAPPRADLAAWTPPGWDGSLVVSSEPGTHVTDPIFDGQPIYVDAAWANYGPDDAARFAITLLLDGEVVGTFESDGLPAGTGQGLEDLMLPPQTEGSHRLEVFYDSLDEVYEFYEGNNTDSLEFPVGASDVTDPVSPPITSFIRVLPNPVTGAAKIELSTLRSACRTEVWATDIHGRRVATIFQGNVPPGGLCLGWTPVDLGGAPLASGVYWLQASIGKERVTSRVTVGR